VHRSILLKRIPLFTAYTIPGPVAGGLLVALLLLAARSTFGFQEQFDNSLSAPLMLIIAPGLAAT
jgi:ESS family glutamate:Na+ symporter